MDIAFTEQDRSFQKEVSDFIDLVFKVYQSFGFNSVLIKLSTRPSNRVGSDLIWDKAENALIEALNSKGLDWELLPGEGAFYGPKIEFSLKDCIGRVWQCGTIQVDFSMPERLGATYIDEDNQRKTPVMFGKYVLCFLTLLRCCFVLPSLISPKKTIKEDEGDNDNDESTTHTHHKSYKTYK